MKKRWILLAGFAVFCVLSACGPGGEAETPPAPSGSIPVSPAPESAPPAPDSAAPASESPAPSGSAVYTDWSKLEDYEPPEFLYSRWYEAPVHELIPLDGGYGTLIPFVGSFPPDLSWGGVYEYGLMTMDGTIVVDTTYSDVYRLNCREGKEKVRLPVLVLMTTTPTTDEEYGYTYGERYFGAAALDGSWSIPPEYDGIFAFSADGFFLWREETVYVYGTDGQLQRSFEYSDAGRLGGDEADIMAIWGDGVLAELDSTTLCFIDLENGERTRVEGIGGIWHEGDGLFPAQDVESGLWGCLDKTGAWIIPAKYEDIWMLGDGSGLAYGYVSGKQVYVDRAGNEYEEDPRPAQEPEEWDWWVTSIEDAYTGEIWNLRSLYRENGQGYLIEDDNGNVLGNTLVMNDAGTQGQCIVNGLFLNIDGETAGYKDQDGNWVFRIPLAEAGD